MRFYRGLGSNNRFEVSGGMRRKSFLGGFRNDQPVLCMGKACMEAWRVKKGAKMKKKTYSISEENRV